MGPSLGPDLRRPPVHAQPGRLPPQRTPVALPDLERWPKDGAHILQLTPAEVERIESGATSVVERHGFRARLAAFRWEWETWLEGGNPSGTLCFSGSSIGQQAGMHGTKLGGSDTAQETRKWPFKKDTRQLAPAGLPAPAPHPHATPHVGGHRGLVGILLWLAFLGSHMWAVRAVKGALWGGLVVALSCVFEDTLETHAGAMVAALGWALAGGRQTNNPKAASATS